MSKNIPILDFKVIRAETIDDMMETNLRIRVKINGKYYTGVLEMSE